MQKGELRSALPLSGEEKLRLEARFAQICSEPVAFTVKVDPELICGIRVSVGGKIYDMSYRTRLKDIHALLKGGGNNDA